MQQLSRGTATRMPATVLCMSSAAKYRPGGTRNNVTVRIRPSWPACGLAPAGPRTWLKWPQQSLAKGDHVGQGRGQRRGNDFALFRRCRPRGCRCPAERRPRETAGVEIRGAHACGG